jgi:hypothetical protein
MKEFNCPVCGKHFVSAAKHLYKDGKNLFCSWSCFIHRNETVKPRGVEQYSKYGISKHTYKSVDEAAAKIGGSAIDIVEACQNCTFYKGFLWRYKNDVS